MSDLDLYKIVDEKIESIGDLVLENERLKKALRRLASTQSFTTALDIDHAKPEALAAELRARGMFAQEALAAEGEGA